MKYTGMDEETVRTAMKNVNYTYDLSIDGETEYVDFLSRLKYIDIPIRKPLSTVSSTPEFLKSCRKMRFDRYILTAHPAGSVAGALQPQAHPEPSAPSPG
jgi:hypothetical protein